MPSNKLAAAAAVSLEQDPTDPQLPLDNIQGDILLGLAKSAELFIFFEIVDIQAFKHSLHHWAASGVTSTADVRSDERRLRAAKQAAALIGTRLKRLEIRHVNIAFSAAGLEKLKPGSLTSFPTDFRAGAAAAAARLHDPVSGGAPSSWEPGFDEQHQDGVLLVTGETLAGAEEKAESVIQKLGAGFREVHRHVGEARPGAQRGHEHFGFEDGVSQPGIRGLTARENPNDSDQGVPGQDLLWPGEFVFGWPGQTSLGTDITPAGPVKAPPIDWMADGAFMVFRKLEQRVPEFHAFVKATAVTLAIDSELLGARMVGRWASGAPLVKAPIQDDEVLADDRLRNNAFEFDEDDALQRRCPYGAHIRKTYPRDDTGNEVDVQHHRLRRAGIPYGPEVDEETEEQTTAPGKERGLSFVAYMTSITNQFEFVQTAWVNTANFVSGKLHPDGTPSTPGIDTIIGQPGPGEIIALDEPVPNYPVGNVRSTLTMPGSFIKPRAAGYYFMPSIHALRRDLT